MLFVLRVLLASFRKTFFNINSFKFLFQNRFFIFGFLQISWLSTNCWLNNSKTHLKDFIVYFSMYFVLVFFARTFLLYHFYVVLSIVFCNIFLFLMAKKLVTFMSLFNCPNITNYIHYLVKLYNPFFIFSWYFLMILLFEYKVKSFFKYFLNF